MTDKEKLDKAVDDFAERMKMRLDEKREQGYTGWNDYSVAFFMRRFFWRLDEKTVSIIDLCNFLMMADFNEETTLETTEAARKIMNDYIDERAIELLKKVAIDVRK